jgi:hypothetical protein
MRILAGALMHAAAAKAVLREAGTDPDRLPFLLGAAAVDGEWTAGRREDFHPADWVRLDPPVPSAAVTHMRLHSRPTGRACCFRRRGQCCPPMGR